MDISGGGSSGPCLDTVRALHQTVVALRAALEQSRAEISQLKHKKTLTGNNNDHKNDENIKNVKPSRVKKNKIQATIRVKKINSEGCPSLESLTVLEAPFGQNQKYSLSKTVSFSDLRVDREIVRSDAVTSQTYRLSDENLEAPKPPKAHTLDSLPKQTTETVSEPKLLTEKTLLESTMEKSAEDPVEPEVDQDQEEVDDIELIFTTDDTKDSDFKGQLVSIETGDSMSGNLLQVSDLDVDANLDCSDRELEDDVFGDPSPVTLMRDNSQLYNSKSDNSINRDENKSLKSCYSYQDSSFENKSLEKDESFDRFEERIRIVETDISKCGIQETEYPGLRRNTCPNPLQYRPLVHR